ncbi:hypothetical protein AGMMS49938_02570 [Fibrobacterales bacterium]|nr:hypothetical protein AGMMS49938_02570 [Fibrobacterales bacterium]
MKRVLIILSVFVLAINSFAAWESGALREPGHGDIKINYEAARAWNGDKLWAGPAFTGFRFIPTQNIELSFLGEDICKPTCTYTVGARYEFAKAFRTYLDFGLPFQDSYWTFRGGVQTSGSIGGVVGFAAGLGYRYETENDAKYQFPMGLDMGIGFGLGLSKHSSIGLDLDYSRNLNNAKQNGNEIKSGKGKAWKNAVEPKLSLWYTGDGNISLSPYIKFGFGDAYRYFKEDGTENGNDKGLKPALMIGTAGVWSF